MTQDRDMTEAEVRDIQDNVVEDLWPEEEA